MSRRRESSDSDDDMSIASISDRSPIDSDSDGEDEVWSPNYLLTLDRRWNAGSGGIFPEHIYFICMLMRSHYIELYKKKGGKNIELFECQKDLQDLPDFLAKNEKLGDKPFFMNANVFQHYSVLTNLWHPKLRMMVYLDSGISEKKLAGMDSTKQTPLYLQTELRKFLKFADIKEGTIPIVLTEYQDDTNNCGLYLLAFMDQAYRIALDLNKDNENAVNLTIPDPILFRRTIYQMIKEKKYIQMKDNLYFYVGNREPTIIRRIRKSERLAF